MATGVIGVILATPPAIVAISDTISIIKNDCHQKWLVRVDEILTTLNAKGIIIAPDVLRDFNVKINDYIKERKRFEDFISTGTTPTWIGEGRTIRNSFKKRARAVWTTGLALSTQASYSMSMCMSAHRGLPKVNGHCTICVPPDMWNVTTNGSHNEPAEPSANFTPIQPSQQGITMSRPPEISVSPPKYIDGEAPHTVTGVSQQISTPLGTFQQGNGPLYTRRTLRRAQSCNTIEYNPWASTPSLLRGNSNKNKA